MVDTPGRDDGRAPTIVERIDLVRWHLNRYDQLRSSTTARASVILSATAILSAGNVVALSLVLGDNDWLTLGVERTVLTVAIGLTATLIVVGLIQTTALLATPKESRSMFAGGQDLPSGLIFNGTDTTRELSSFDDFVITIETQAYQQILRAAQVELWIVIQQHRWRYARLRTATRLLRWSATAFLAILLSAVVLALVESP